MPKKKKATTKELEQHFAATAFRLTQERSDFLLPQVRDFVSQKKWINLRPEYQRRTVWDDAKRSLFIESLLLNVPIPPIFLYESDLSRYEVMDGQQRLNAIVDFYENSFALKGLERWALINGWRYSELPETLKRGLDRRRISATVLLVGGGEEGEQQPEKSDVRKLVFDRLNTGGQPLNGQELRNCLYAGNFNDLVTNTLSADPVFTTIWGIPSHADNIDKAGKPSEGLRKNALYKRMLDCELVLRFFAFRKSTNIKGSVRVMLDRVLEEHQNVPGPELAQMAQDFKDRIRLAKEVFGAKVFRYNDKDGKPQLSQPLYDGVMVALERLWPKRKDILASKAAVVKSVDRLFKDDQAFEVIVGKPNTAKAVQKRLDLLTKAIEGAL
jgi:hypothetical protein